LIITVISIEKNGVKINFAPFLMLFSYILVYFSKITTKYKKQKENPYKIRELGR